MEENILGIGSMVKCKAEGHLYSKMVKNTSGIIIRTKNMDLENYFGIIKISLKFH